MLKIYGASDDLVEIEGPGGDEVDCYDSSVLITIGWPEAQAGKDAKGLVVRMRYGSPGFGGTWSAEVGQIDEDFPIPWPVRIEVAERPYSALVIVDCPDDTPVSWKVEEK